VGRSVHGRDDFHVVRNWISSEESDDPTVDLKFAPSRNHPRGSRWHSNLRKLCGDYAP
jgi:hypothetical protein